MSAQQTIDDDILQCFQELFPHNITISQAFVEYVKPEGLKSAYRQRIKENHPDKASKMGMTEADLSERFRKITTAYHRLIPYINGTIKLRPINYPKTTAGSYTQPQTSTTNHSHSNATKKWPGHIPQVHLRLGEYLYYTGKITWDELWAALRWQREKRPLIGNLALEWNYLTHGDLTCIFKQLKPGERFGTGAVRLGLLTPYQRLALLGRQAGYKQRLGQYFMEKGKFSAMQMDTILIELRRHNFSVKQNALKKNHEFKKTGI